MLTLTPEGIHCPEGGFHIDPRRPVRRAVVTHAHSDHARPGSSAYLCAGPGEGVLRERVGGDAAAIETLPYGRARKIGGVTVSFHPSGHLLGAAQVRIERGGRVCVVTGDYKRQADPTCAAFEPVACHSFFTECTFGLPVYRWPDPVAEGERMNHWWRANREAGRTSVVFAYALGKAQRVLSLLDPLIGPIGVHGSVARFSPHYRRAGAPLPFHRKISGENRGDFGGGGIIIAPGSTEGSPWLRKFGEVSTAFASGWMRLRGHRRRRAVDRGFVLSDHIDWPDLLRTIDETGAEFIGAMHGATGPLVRYLRENGLRAEEVTGYREREDHEKDLE